MAYDRRSKSKKGERFWGSRSDCLAAWLVHLRLLKYVRRELNARGAIHPPLWVSMPRLFYDSHASLGGFPMVVFLRIQSLAWDPSFPPSMGKRQGAKLNSGLARVLKNPLHNACVATSFTLPLACTQASSSNRHMRKLTVSKRRSNMIRHAIQPDKSGNSARCSFLRLQGSQSHATL